MVINSLTKQTGEFLVPKTLRCRFGGLFAMENVIGIEETPPALEQFFKATTNRKCELPIYMERESVPLMKI